MLFENYCCHFLKRGVDAVGRGLVIKFYIYVSIGKLYIAPFCELVN